MNKLPKVENSDLRPSEIYLAKCLIRYHRWSFDVRAQGILKTKIDPPEVRELVNFLMWVAGGFGPIDAGSHIIGLQEVVKSSAKEMESLVSYVREYGATQPLVKEINYLQEQMEAADTLMGYLVDGR